MISSFGLTSTGASLRGEARGWVSAHHRLGPGCGWQNCSQQFKFKLVLLAVIECAPPLRVRLRLGLVPCAHFKLATGLMVAVPVVVSAVLAVSAMWALSAQYCACLAAAQY